MSAAKIPVIIFFVLLAFCSKGESFWKIRTESGEEILLSIEVNNTTKTFKAFTRKDAIKDIAGFFTYNLAHAAGKLKYPEIVYIEGKANQLKDSLKLEGVFYYTDKKYDFQASISGINFQGKYTDNKNRQHRLVGCRQTNGKPIRNYAEVLNRTIANAEKYLVNLEWLKSSEWQDFKEAAADLKDKISDDYELGALVMWYARKFPFPFFDVNKLNPERVKGSHTKLQLDELRPHIALLTANHLPETEGQLDSLSVIISRKSINKLIIDLRGRSSVNLLQFRFILNYFCSRNTTIGAFVSRRFQNLHQAFQSRDLKTDDFKSIQELVDNYRFIEDMGVKINVHPAKQKFSGELYVLTDSKTSKVAEVLAYTLQREKSAKIVGQKTAGQPFLTEKIQISDGFELQLPVGVFFSSEGVNMIMLGVNPNIVPRKENALNYLLKTL